MNPFYQGARFLSAATRVEQAPPDAGHEVAFAGRSNAGKSSAINALCHQRGLARTSKTPGRTQLLVFFRLDDERRLVDLPGYGYARVAESIKLEWQAHMAVYLERRRSLSGLIIVMDCRHPLADYDRQMLAWGRRAKLPVLMLLTKSDKLKRGALLSTVRAVEREVGAAAEVLTFSAMEQTGVEPVQSWLDRRLGVDPTPAATVTT
jgi:GTP-binding protein